MPKTLYISDLDGTLLNSNKELSPFTRETINKFISMGGHFSVATARTAASTSKILAELDVKVPAVLMNGAVIYDLGNERYIKTEIIPEDEARIVIDTINEYGISGFMYAIRNGILVTYYENLKTRQMKEFHDERVQRYYKSFEQVKSFIHKAAENNVIYFTLIDEYEGLSYVCNELKNCGGIDMTLYKDIYEPELWYLEIYSVNASKFNAVSFLRREYGYDRVVGYGDNNNDIPMLKACDEFYAAANGVEQLRAMATAVIGSNIDDGVARHILDRELGLCGE